MRIDSGSSGLRAASRQPPSAAEVPIRTLAGRLQ
jgi:hypothetical protein